jgi:5-methylcytosine-specific restriction endonuclease McrA
MKPPWIRPTENLFKTVSKTQGNESDNHKRYNNHAWRKVSTAFFRGKKCEEANCIMLAYCTDHIIPITDGGSQWDRRNWQRLCRKHHDRKRGREAHGNIEPSIDTPHGKIPTRRQHLEPDIANQSYLLK